MLRTARLVLRPWCDDDREPFAALNADPVVMELFPSTLDRAASDALMDRIVERWSAGRPSLWAVELPDEAPFIGFTGLLEPGFDASFTPCVEVGWRLAAGHWGNGYAPEAARAALAHGFDGLGLEEVVSFTSTQNHRSRRVMEKLGMRRDPDDDFDHPGLEAGDPLRRHVLYRLRADDFAAAGGRG